jgi:hypothetical protein
MRRALAAAAVATVVAVTLAGCSGSDEPSAGGEETSSASPSESASDSGGESPSASEDEGTVIEIQIKGDTIEPQGKSVEVKAGEPVTLKVSSDRTAELHVHSSPEQELEVEKGESTLSLTLDTPGVVDVEEHESDVVVLRLEVR